LEQGSFVKISPSKRHFPYKHPTFGTAARPKPASAWQKTIYYLWWAYLKRNQTYLDACAKGGAGALAAIYADFGDVRGDDFKVWWTEGGRGVRLFAEPRAEDSVRVLQEGERALAASEALTLSLPLSLPKRLLERRIKELLAKHHTGKRGHQLAKKSQAKYRVQGQPNINALALGLEVYDFKQANPDLALWEIGNRVRRVSMDNKLEQQDKKPDKTTKKRIMAATVSRYLKRVKLSIERTGAGLFL